MHINYDRVAPTYDRHRRGGGPYLDHLIALASQSHPRTVLELGAGTGNNTLAFSLGYTGSQLLCLERSAGMLRRGASKPTGAFWIQGDALQIPLASASVDFVFSIYMLHHIRHLDVLFRECARVLRQGCAIFVTTTHRFIRRHPMTRYFPSFAEIDTGRFQDVSEVARELSRAGFSQVGQAVCVAEPTPVDSAYVEKVAGKFLSTFELMPPDEFESGLAQLRRDVERQGALAEPVAWESALVWGYR
ncbi:MAG: methyltransferase domain-containing protein [Candidatus Hydrogenedentes bacterium]|nr:methyltransferase domain-containing protein [Candidatus Hydrogenedentota bacterium]